MSEISADPQKPLYGQKFLSRRKIFRVKNRVKFCIRDCSEVKMGQKIRPRVSEDFLGPKVTTPEILGSAEISTGLGVFLKIWVVGQNFFQKSYIFKKLKNHHFSTFVVFFFHFGQSGLSCPHLPNFASQKFLGSLGVPHENWKNCKISTLLKST